MRNILPFIILALISSISLKLDETNYDFVISLGDTTENSVFNKTTIALYTNITNPIEIFDTSDFEKIIFDIALKGDNDISINMKCHLWKKSEKNYLSICDIYNTPLDTYNSYY